jgi:V/A-type H+-transporting ATPase subunit I
MALDTVVKVEITAHGSIMDTVLEELQKLSVIQIDAHSVKEYESDRERIQVTSQRIVDMKKELSELERAIGFLENSGPKVSFFQKLTAAPVELSRDSLKDMVEKEDADSLKKEALELERELNEKNGRRREHLGQREGLLPFSEFQPPLDMLKGSENVGLIFSRLERESFENLLNVDVSKLIHIEKISGEETVFFFVVFHKSTADAVLELEKSFNFEPMSLPDSSKSPAELINEHTAKIQELEDEIGRLKGGANVLASRTAVLRCFYDLLQTEIETESAKEKFFYTKKVFLINGWIRERDFHLLVQMTESHQALHVSKIEKEKDEVQPVAYRNNPVVAPFELIVNLYSPPNPREIDPTPFIMPFYTLFFGICLTEAGYGFIITVISLLGLVILKPKNGMRRFLTLFLILGIGALIIGALMGTVFGIDFNMLPRRFARLKEIRDAVLIFDASKDVLTFFSLALALGVIHLIVGYCIKIYMLIKSGDWVEAVCDHLPWVFLLLAPIPKVLMRALPGYESQLNTLFYVLLALWAGIIVLFSERNSLNPIKRIGKGLFTLYGVSGVLGDVLSYSRLLALGLATGVIAGVMNTLAGMVRQIPIVGIIGFVLVLIVGHLFNLFISGLSAFVHSIRLQFMEFFTKFYTGEGSLMTVFAERRKYTYVPRESRTRSG